MPGARILVLVNSAWNITNFRMGLLKSLRERGCEIIIAAPAGVEVAEIEGAGFRFRPLRLEPKGRNPLSDLRTIGSCLRAIREERPDLVMSYTVKPNVYGGLAARIAGVPTLPNIAGLGAAFSGGLLLRTIASVLYRVALRKASRAFFQNSEDRALFVAEGIVRAEQTGVLPGSGVDTSKFEVAPLPFGPVRFGMIARLVGDKGVRDYVEAARLIRQKWDCDFVLAGFLEPDHSGSVTRGEIDAWEREGILRYLGPLSDVRPALVDLHCLVLPTYYREGTPRSLLEAASMGRVLITTDHPGCRNTVDEGITGYLVSPRDPAALADAMERLCALSQEARIEMGLAGRGKIEAEFSERLVVAAYVDAIRSALTKTS